MNPKKYSNLKFSAEPGKLFVIMLVNFFFTILTLGLYYPWAKAKLLQYFYSETEFQGSRFVFHGTGKEMFRAFIKVYIGVIIVYGSIQVFKWMGDPTLLFSAVAFSYFVIVAIIPLAIHGTLRYRLSRSSWRGIHFGYRGSLGELYKIYIKGILLSIITFGIYSSWFSVAMRTYIMKNIRFGSLEFKFKGDGGDLFGLHVIGYILTIITFGIYMPWYTISIKNYKIKSTSVVQNGVEYPVESTMEGGTYFALNLINFLILICTLGLGSVFVIIRNLEYELSNIYFSNGIDMNAIVQSESDYKNAIGEDLSDTLDLNIF